MAEYNARKTLAKLGFTQSFSELDEYSAKVFVRIAYEIDKQEHAEMKRPKKRR